MRPAWSSCAVWTTNSRLPATTEVPSQAEATIPEPTSTLHVVAGAAGFDLQWKRGPTLLRETHVERRSGDGRLDDLATAVRQAWLEEHPTGSEASRADTAVVHVADASRFEDLARVLDAIAATRRRARGVDGKWLDLPAFSASLAVR